MNRSSYGSLRGHCEQGAGLEHTLLFQNRTLTSSRKLPCLGSPISTNGTSTHPDAPVKNQTPVIPSSLPLFPRCVPILLLELLECLSGCSSADCTPAEAGPATTFLSPHPTFYSVLSASTITHPLLCSFCFAFTKLPESSFRNKKGNESLSFLHETPQGFPESLGTRGRPLTTARGLLRGQGLPSSLRPMSCGSLQVTSKSRAPSCSPFLGMCFHLRISSHLQGPLPGCLPCGRSALALSHLNFFKVLLITCHHFTVSGTHSAFLSPREPQFHEGKDHACPTAAS